MDLMGSGFHCCMVLVEWGEEGGRACEDGGSVGETGDGLHTSGCCCVVLKSIT